MQLYMSMYCMRLATLPVYGPLVGPFAEVGTALPPRLCKKHIFPHLMSR